MNLAQALLMTGDWDIAEAELAQPADPDGLADIELLACYRAWLAALRGDTPAAQAALAGLGDLRASEDPQDQATIAVAEAFTAAARRQPAAALRHARAALDHAAALGISAEFLRWAWPLAVRAAHDLADTAATADLLTLLDGYQPGQLAPMLRAERDLARARLAASDPDARLRGIDCRDRRAAPALHPLPPGPRAARPRRPPDRPRQGRGRRGRGRRSRPHRRPAGLPAAAGPRGNHPARQAPHRGLVTTAPASPAHLPAAPSLAARGHGQAFRSTASSPATRYRPCRCVRPRRSSGSGALPRH